MVSNQTTAVSYAVLLRARTEVSLLPVMGGFDGTTVPSGSPIATVTTKNAGLTGTPGSPNWNHPV
jgi:hypothetical protein